VVEVEETGGEGKSIFYDCVILPLADDRSLFIGEHISSDASMQEIIQRLNRRIKMFQVESEHAKKIARNKQTEVDGIMVQAHELTNTDVLTFLPNRRMIVKTLQDEVARAERYSAPLSISVVDVDFFKRVNDTHGHMVGDDVLRHVALLLREPIRHPDVVGRYGGEEFLILLPNTASDEAAEQASRLCRHVRESQVNVNQHYLSLTVSIGVAQYVPGADTWDSLLNRADNAMYEAKNNGRDRWHVAK
jgi:diguanylate cyclase (GGDEF)-like protein